jgi:soluble lytic murein transglycosylase-like protein
MRVKAIVLWSILIFLPIPFAHAQETEAFGAAHKVRARATLYEPLIASAAQRYNVDPRLLWTIAYLESRFTQGAISYKNGKACAYGMMQFTVPTAARYGLKNPHDVRAAVDAAARYVRDLQMRFGGRGDLILAAYNAGEGTVEAFRAGKRLVLPNKKIINPAGIQTGGIPPYQETRKYVERANTIYQSISRAALFRGQEGLALERSANAVVESKTALADTFREDSVYSSQSAGKPPAQPTVKSEKSRGTTSTSNSIYVN